MILDPLPYQGQLLSDSHFIADLLEIVDIKIRELARVYSFGVLHVLLATVQ